MIDAVPRNPRLIASWACQVLTNVALCDASKDVSRVPMENCVRYRWPATKNVTATSVNQRDPVDGFRPPKMVNKPDSPVQFRVKTSERVPPDRNRELNPGSRFLPPSGNDSGSHGQSQKLP
jgi:hypothetical protein